MKYLIFPSTFLCALIVKFLFIPANIAEAIVFIGLLGLLGFGYFIEIKKEKPINDEIKKEIDVMKKELRDMNNFLQTNKLVGQFRSNK